MLFWSNSYSVFVGTISLLVSLDIVAFSLRIYVRRALRQKLHVEDWLIACALTLDIGLTISAFIGVADHILSFRLPAGDVTPELAETGRQKLFKMLKLEFAVLLISIASLTMVKLSFLFFYKRVFVYDIANWKNFRNAFLNFLIGLTIVWGLGFLLTFFTECRDHFHARFSTPAVAIAHCVDRFAFIDALAISDFIMDCFIILTPVPFIWRLKLSVPRRLGIMLTFLLGALAVASSLIRMIWFNYVMASKKKEPPRRTPNASNWRFEVVTSEFFWFVVEATVACLAACLPPISGFRRTPAAERISRWIGNIFGKKSQGSGDDSMGPRSSQSSDDIQPENVHIITYKMV